MLSRISPSATPLRALAFTAMFALAFSALTAGAQNSTAVQVQATSPVASAAPVASPAPQLSSGVADVLKLSQAKVSDATVVAYIQSSDRGYGALSASEIAYLHEAGVSDVVVKAMLDKRKGLADANAQFAQAQPQATQPVAAPASVWQTPAYTPSAVTQPAPAPNASVVYVPNTPMFPPRQYYYPYYSGYGGYGGYGYGYGGYGYSGFYGPSVSLSFGFGGRYRGGWGGYHGGHGWHHR